MGTPIPPDPPPDPVPCRDCWDDMPDTMSGRLRIPAMGWDFQGTVYKGSLGGVNYAGTLHWGIRTCFMYVWFCHTVPGNRGIECWGGYLGSVVYACSAGPDSWLPLMMCTDTASYGLGIMTVE
jgi:hypothetical protein